MSDRANLLTGPSPWRNAVTQNPAALGGVLGAVTTLVMLALVNPFGSTGPEQRGFGLRSGDCFEVRSGSGDEAEVEAVDCAQPHDAQVTGRVEHVDGDQEYPGQAATGIWFEEGCGSANADYLQADVLDTTLGWGRIEPTAQEWEDGTTHAVCYLTTSSSDTELTGSLDGGWDRYARDERVAVNRLKPGDCFTPPAGRSALGLTGNDLVTLVGCETSFNGVFFGRTRLHHPLREQFPPLSELTDASTEACSQQFERFYGVEAFGSNFRFWRPSPTAWAAGDRQVLCAVLSDQDIVGPYSPADQQTLFELSAATCFDLGPEQTADSLAIDDRVNLVECATVHDGQKLGGGRLSLDSGEPYPGADEVKQRAAGACEKLFNEFVGVERRKSRYGNFPYWYPDEEAWNQDDRRFSCAVVGTEELVGSLENRTE